MEAEPERKEKIETFLTGLLERLEVPAEIKLQVNEAGIYQVELVGKNLGALIGRRGETLDAIQQLTNYAVNRGQSKRIRIHIDAENYRAKREESLQRLARKTAGKALKYRRNMMLEPMNAYERHVIHAALQSCYNLPSPPTPPAPNPTAGSWWYLTRTCHRAKELKDPPAAPAVGFFSTLTPLEEIPYVYPPLRRPDPFAAQKSPADGYAWPRESPSPACQQNTPVWTSPGCPTGNLYRGGHGLCIAQARTGVGGHYEGADSCLFLTGEVPPRAFTPSPARDSILLS